MTASPTKLTMDMLRGIGYTVEKVEHFNVFAKVRQDFAGFADLIAFQPDQGIIAVQATSDDNAGNHARRRTKILASTKAREWIASGGRVMVVSWRRPVKNKKKQRRWESRYEELTLADFTAADAAGATL